MLVDPLFSRGGWKWEESRGRGDYDGLLVLDIFSRYGLVLSIYHLEDCHSRSRLLF